MSERRLKQPAEKILWAPFALLTGSIVTGLSWLSRGLVPGSAALTLPAGGSPAFTQGAFLVGGGTDGETYLVTATATLPDGEIVERELELVVLDATWAMPGGGAAYLTIAEFVKRFGLTEVIAMTDADGSGRIDRDYLVGALVAAQGEADINLGARYAVPLAIAPEAIKTAIGDLARARLYPRGAPEGVADLAKAASRMLERIATGALPLSLPTGATAAAPAITDTPVLISGRGRRVYPDGLGDVL